MNNSDRAKFYRIRNKERACHLAADVATLHTQVHQLDLGTQVLRSLVSCGVHSESRVKIVTLLKPFILSPHITIPGFDSQHAELHTASGYGSFQAPIIQVSARVTGKYPPSSLEAIYHCIPGNSVLLDTLMHSVIVYPCSIRFFFACDGTLATTEIEIDWIHGLQACVSALTDVTKVAKPLQELGKPYVSWTADR